MDFIREYWWLILIAVALVALAFLLLRPRQSVRLTDSAPIRPHMAAPRPPEGRGLADEVGACGAGKGSGTGCRRRSRGRYAASSSTTAAAARLAPTAVSVEVIPVPPNCT